jgi:hypothetical protein
MAEATDMLLQTFELTLTHLCGKNVQPFAGMPIYVGLTAEDRRQNKHVRFAYGMYYQDQGFVPID